MNELQTQMSVSPEIQGFLIELETIANSKTQYAK